MVARPDAIAPRRLVFTAKKTLESPRTGVGAKHDAGRNAAENVHPHSVSGPEYATNRAAIGLIIADGAFYRLVAFKGTSGAA
jgi:hypothetical protein